MGGYTFFSVTSTLRVDDAMSFDFGTAKEVV